MDDIGNFVIIFVVGHVVVDSIVRNSVLDFGTCVLVGIFVVDVIFVVGNCVVEAVVCKRVLAFGICVLAGTDVADVTGNFLVIFVVST